MIICPFCKEEIDEGSHFCDQCGKKLQYCSKCGYVGTGRRCTHCGGLMVSAEERENLIQSTTMSDNFSQPTPITAGRVMQMEESKQDQQVVMDNSLPNLTLINRQLNISLQGVNGAIIGRRQGPYRHIFERNMYVSGVHAQIYYTPDKGWCVMDKNSSNGSKLNGHRMTPERGEQLHNGDVLAIANVTLQVIIQ